MSAILEHAFESKSSVPFICLANSGIRWQLFMFIFAGRKLDGCSDRTLLASRSLTVSQVEPWFSGIRTAEMFTSRMTPTDLPDKLACKAVAVWIEHRSSTQPVQAYNNQFRLSVLAC